MTDNISHSDGSIGVTSVLFRAPEFDEAELSVLGQIDAARDRLRLQLGEPRRWYGPLLRLSFARNIQGSNSIEGYDANLDDAAAVALGEEPLDADEETRRALAGYRDAMTYVLQLATEDEFEYNTQLIKSLHFMMTGYSLVNRPGLWRSGAVYVQKEQTGEIVYEAPDLDLVPGLISELMDEMNGHAGDVPLLRAGMAHMNLVMIHPFRDGNGRMARCLQSLMLARSGILSPVFMSIEEYLGRNTQEYYDVLARVGRGSWRPDGDARAWVRFTLTAHLRQAHTMLRRIRESEQIWVELERLVARDHLPERTMGILYDAAMGLRVRNSTYRAVLRDAGEEISDQTASRDLRSLLAANIIAAHGERRGRSYVAGPELRSIRQTIVAARDKRDDIDVFE